MAKIADMQEVSLDLIKPYERNAKIHGEDQIQMLMNSIKEFGFLSPYRRNREQPVPQTDHAKGYEQFFLLCREAVSIPRKNK